MLLGMHFLLLHSPLVTKETWVALIPRLNSAGFSTMAVAFDNEPTDGRQFFERHISQIDSALSGLKGENIVAVAHSGAGSLLACLDPRRITAYVFLDAIFPLSDSSRFALFDDSEVVQQWRSVASRAGGMIPRSMLIRFGDQIEDRIARETFVADMVGAPIDLYEELIPVHQDWPPSNPGLYLRWTETYSADASRAEDAGFLVQADPASHFEMLNHPEKIAQVLIGFAQSVI